MYHLGQTVLWLDGSGWRGEGKWEGGMEEGFVCVLSDGGGWV